MRARSLLLAAPLAALLLVTACGDPTTSQAETGYFIKMPAKAGSPSGPHDTGGTVSMTTNLPEGTLVAMEGKPTGGGGGAGAMSTCCPSVSSGTLTLSVPGGACGLSPDGVESTGFTVRVVVTANPAQSRVCGAFCTFPQEQPPNVQEELGPNFENLEGRQVTTVDGKRALVATGEFDWPPHSCDAAIAAAMPEQCPAGTMSINDDEGGENIKAVGGSVIGTLSQLRLCDLYNYATDGFQKANPWPEFRDRTRAWVESHRPLAGPNYDFYLKQENVRRSSKTIGGEFDSPEWLEVDYFLHGEKVAHARFVARIWYSGYTKWDMAELVLF